MKKLTKLLALMLALALVFSLAACSSKGDAKVNPPAPGESTPAESEPSASAKPADSEPAVPADTEPAETQPVETQPVETQPVETQPVQPAQDDSLVGKWYTTLDMDMLIEMNGESVDEETLQMMEMLLDGFSGFGMYLEFHADGSAKLYMDPDSATVMIEIMLENLPPVLAEAMGMTLEEMEALLAEQGMTMDDVMEQVAAELDTEELLGSFDEMNMDAYYRYDGSRLFVSDTPNSFDESNYLICGVSGNVLTFTGVEGDGVDFGSDLPPMPWIFNRAN